MLRTLYALFGAAVILGYGYVGWRGIEPMTRTHRQYVAGGLRGASHGGYRSFWYSGYHGGK